MAKTRRVSRRVSKKSAPKVARKSSRKSKVPKRSKAMLSTVHEYDNTSEIPMELLRKKVQKKSKFVKRKRSSKRKGKSPYNLFVKKRFAVHKKENSGLKAPEIMKKIAKEWKSR